MQAISKRGLWTSVLAAGILGLAAVAFSGSAAAGGGVAAGDATIRIKATDNGLFFRGPDKVSTGEQLRVVNRTDPQQIGPHTFTLVRPSLIPEGRQIRKCERLESKLCSLVLEAHEVGPPPDFEVGERVVDVGQPGWDRRFSKESKGDSWYTDALGEDHSRKVRAEAGKRFGFFCLIHPFMHGTIKVTR